MIRRGQGFEKTTKNGVAFNSSQGSVQSIHKWCYKAITMCLLMILFLSVVYFLERKCRHEEGSKWHFHASIDSLAFKKWFKYFTYESHGSLKSFSLILLIKLETRDGAQRKIRNLSWFTFSNLCRIWSFSRCWFAADGKKCTKNYNARARPFFVLVTRFV